MWLFECENLWVYLFRNFVFVEGGHVGDNQLFQGFRGVIFHLNLWRTFASFVSLLGQSYDPQRFRIFHEMPWKKEWLWKKYGSTGAGSPVRAPSVFISCKDAKISVENQRPGIELAENHYCLKQTIFPPVFSSGLQWCPQPNSFPFCLSKRLLHRAKQRLKRRVRRLVIKTWGNFTKCLAEMMVEMLSSSMIIRLSERTKMVEEIHRPFLLRSLGKCWKNHETYQVIWLSMDQETKGSQRFFLWKCLAGEQKEGMTPPCGHEPWQTCITYIYIYKYTYMIWV